MGVSIIDPRDPPYGAMGNGNDTTAFQAAITASQIQKIPLYLPPGNWTVDTLTFDPDRPIIVKGAGSLVVNLNKLSPDSTSLFTVPQGLDYNYQMQMSGFTLIGVVGKTISCLALNHVSKAFFKDILVKNAINGFSQVNCVNNTFDSDCTATACQYGVANTLSNLIKWKGALSFNTTWGMGNFTCQETILDGADIELNGAPGTNTGAVISDSNCGPTRFRDTWIEGNKGLFSVLSQGGYIDWMGGQSNLNTGAINDFYIAGGRFSIQGVRLQGPRATWLYALDPGVQAGNLVRGVIGGSAIAVDNRTTVLGY